MQIGLVRILSGYDKIRMMRSLRQYSWLVGALCVVSILLFVAFVPRDGSGGLFLLHRQKAHLKMESECRRHFEAIFQDEFPSCRPSFLLNTQTGHNLELDGFNPRLKVAFEYNGSQHYFYNPFFHATERAFEKMKERDELKRTLCDRAGIRLITIPYTVREHEIGAYIRDQLREHVPSGRFH